MERMETVSVTCDICRKRFLMFKEGQRWESEREVFWICSACPAPADAIQTTFPEHPGLVIRK